MNIKFIIDTQLPPVIADFFSVRGYDSVHTTFFPNGHRFTDKQIREIASSENRIIISKDQDFIDYYLIKGAPPKILLIETGNICNKDLLKLLSNNLKEIINSFENGNELVIIQTNNLIAY